MKKPFTLLFATLLCKIVFTQTLNKADLIPQIGESYLRHSIDDPTSIDPGQIGTGRTWDLSNGNFSLQNDYLFQVVNPAATPHTVAGSTYAAKNNPLTDSTYASYAYYRDTANGFYELHDYGKPLELNFYSQEFIYKFPLRYGDSVVDNFCYTSSAFSITYNYCGTSKLKFDGTGTLLLGGAPITNVYRFKYESTVIRQNPLDTSHITNYYWYQAGIHHPIAEYTSYLDPNGATYQSAKVYTLANTTGIESAAINTSFAIYPNPASTRINVSTANNGHFRYHITNVLGEMLLTGTLEDLTSNIDISNLPNGVYSLLLFNDKIVESHLFIRN